MAYEVPATSNTPALIIYVIDVSASMQNALGNKRRIEVVSEAFDAALRQMVFRSTKGARISPRYRIAMFGYSDDVHDLLGGIQPVDKVAELGSPEFETQRSTDSYKAFVEVEKLLKSELPKLQGCPAPLVCHMTDGEYTGPDPEPVVKRIMKLQVPDGSVLVENIFLSDRVLTQPIADPHDWAGIRADTPLGDDYAKKLRAISSPLPASYWAMMRESGYRIDDKARMLLPGHTPDLVEMGFVMSASTRLV